MTPEQEELAERARQVVAVAARQLVLRTPVADQDELGPDGLRSDALVSLRALAFLGRAVEECAAQAARDAAQEGANYPQLGKAWGVSRQGARKRWPGLVITARPASRPLPHHQPGAPS